jgi:hypothetical protein
VVILVPYFSSDPHAVFELKGSFSPILRVNYGASVILKKVGGYYVKVSGGSRWRMVYFKGSGYY